MQLRKLSALCFAAAITLASNAALAWQSEDGQHAVKANALLGSDYVFRGVSQTENKPAIQGGVDYEHVTGFYVGTWASNVNFGNENDASIEMNIYGGLANEFGNTGIRYDLGVVRYIYSGESSLNFNELYGSLGYSFFTFAVAHSNDIFNTGERGTYYNLAFDYELPMGVAFTAAYGYSRFNNKVNGPGEPNSYKDYLIGVSKEFVGLDWALNWTTTDSDGKKLFDSRYADNRFTFSVSKNF
ncbi:hypothetical protein MPL1_01921 [Methylophaga lonarensis MPL]|uniref:Uncharacterized protein n=1 Tax=Methylophaga lonarensis MPL TaxID=1286106 RepID=M7P3B9_9GAMM|nr:TorF family putative porin [Methylophaga lonarensis]EMR14016.1 hypothetical protein MPL1_01921 [Methylophaga lonarensis MPL]